MARAIVRDLNPQPLVTGTKWQIVVNYATDTATSTLAITLDTPLDASVREIEQDSVAAAVANAPVGFSVTESEVIIPDISRG